VTLYRPAQTAAGYHAVSSSRVIWISWRSYRPADRRTKQQSEEIPNFHSWSNMIQPMKTRTMSLWSTGTREICINRLIGIREKTKLYLLPLPVERWVHFGNLGIKWSHYYKMEAWWLDLYKAGYGPVAGSCEYGS